MTVDQFSANSPTPRSRRSGTDTPVTDQHVDDADTIRKTTAQQLTQAQAAATAARTAHADTLTHAGGLNTDAAATAHEQAARDLDAATRAAGERDRYAAELAAHDTHTWQITSERDGLRDQVAQVERDAAVLGSQTEAASAVVSAARGAFPTVRDRAGHARALRDAAAVLRAAMEAGRRAEDAAADAASVLDRVLAGAGLADAGAARRALRTRVQQDELQERITAHEREVAGQKLLLADVDEKLQGVVFPLPVLQDSADALTAARQDAEAAAAAVVQLRGGLDRLRDLTGRARTGWGHLAGLEERRRLVAGLADAVAGRNERRMDLETFVLAAELEQIVQAANLRLHPAFVLLDPGEQERRITGWGRVLATACRSGRIARLQVCERTLPDSGTGLAEWWATHGSDDGSWPATTYRELIERAGPTGERHATTISIALDMNGSGRQIRSAGGGIRGAAAVLRQEMTTFVRALHAADVTTTGWLEPGEVAVILRSAYDPAAAPSLERHADIGRSLATAGPVAVNESWDRVRTDSAHHAVLWLSEWPRSQVYPGFLAPLLLTSGVQRTFSLICTPVRADIAARDLRKKEVGLLSDATQRAKIGQVEDASRTAEYQDVLQQESDLTAGHGVLRYTGLISVSAPTVDELDAAVAAIEQAAVQASCETRRLVGQQATAFAVAALPLCRDV